MSKKTLITKENIVFFPPAKKRDILKSLIEKLTMSPSVNDPAELEYKIFEREALMSTGIGLGIAVPHVRLASVDNVAVVLGICPGGIEDYEALDNEPVKIICMIAANNEQHNEYIQTLATISKQLKNEDIRIDLVNSTNVEDAAAVLEKI